MGRFDNVLIVTDIDGTFLARDNSIPNRNMTALKCFLREGGKFAFATGRVHQSLLVSIPMVNELVSSPCIMANGAYLYDFSTEKMLGKRFVDVESARKVAEFMHDNYQEVGIRYSSTGGTSYCRFPPNYLGTYEREAYKDAPILEKKDWDFTDCYKIVVRGKCEILDEMRRRVGEKFSGVFELVKSGDTFFEIQTKGCTKGSAIGTLREFYKEKGSDVVVYACGDFENDISMLKAADIAVCPENACEAVKQISDLVLCSCDEGLIGDLVNEIEKRVE